MERCRVTPERIEVACRVAVAAVLTQVAKITGVACDAQVQCVFNQYVKDKRYLEFSWSLDDGGDGVLLVVVVVLRRASSTCVCGGAGGVI